MYPNWPGLGGWRDGDHGLRAPPRYGARRTLVTSLMWISAAPGPLAAQLTEYQPPSGARISIPGNGRVVLTLPAGAGDPGESVTLSLLTFRSATTEVIPVTFDASMNPTSGTSATVLRTDPVVLDASGVRVGHRCRSDQESGADAEHVHGHPAGAGHLGSTEFNG